MLVTNILKFSWESIEMRVDKNLTVYYKKRDKLILVDKFVFFFISINTYRGPPIYSNVNFE